MKYNYNFATGKSTIDIDEKWASILTELDRQEKCNNHTETRRHESYTDGNDDYEWLAIEDEDLNNLTAEPSFHDAMLLKLPECLNKLKAQQRAIILAVYFRGYTQKELATLMGISQQAVSQRLEVAEKNLKKFF